MLAVFWFLLLLTRRTSPNGDHYLVWKFISFLGIKFLHLKFTTEFLLHKGNWCLQKKLNKQMLR